MSLSNERQARLLDLLDALCENRLTSEEVHELDRMVVGDDDARRLYLHYIDLHGMLFWDTARAGDAEEFGAILQQTVVSPASSRPTAPVKRTPRWAQWAVVTAVAVVSVALGMWLPRFQTETPDGSPVAGQSPSDVPSDTEAAPSEALPNESTPPPRPVPRIGPGRVVRNEDPDVADPAGHPTDGEDLPDERLTSAPDNVVKAESEKTDDTDPDSVPIAQFVDEQLRDGWNIAGIQPSPVADDAEWLRRVYLDVTGHIPPVDEVEQFLQDPDPDKRRKLVDRLLDDPDYVHNWTTIWTNLLIGRSMSRDVNRPALQKFLRDSFHKNRPWDEVVADLVAAEGDFEQNGAANFLLAHLNNQAVPATAITARLFLGTQVQCTQCHDHPFNDWKQHEFWELNSFFQQTDMVRTHRVDRDKGRKVAQTALVNRPVGGPIFFEDRRGIMSAAFPRFAGEEVDPDEDVNRRGELARLMTSGSQTQVAEAMVNRLWAHFFGYGFTRPVDDMGPHNPPTHPALLDRLAREFVGSGYDVKQLIRWICNSNAYSLTSRFNESNEVDNPDVGHRPWFSRVYVKSMTAEQLYDSLLVATRANLAGTSSWESAARMRQEWLQQFVIAFDTEENDEATTFDGTITQALVMMNSPLVQTAVSADRGTFLHDVATGHGSDAAKIKRLCLASLSRLPTSSEAAVARRVIRTRQRGLEAHGLEDVFWAFLNSNEFILIH